MIPYGVLVASIVFFEWWRSPGGWLTRACEVLWRLWVSSLEPLSIYAMRVSGRMLSLQHTCMCVWLRVFFASRLGRGCWASFIVTTRLNNTIPAVSQLALHQRTLRLTLKMGNSTTLYETFYCSKSFISHSTYGLAIYEPSTRIVHLHVRAVLARMKPTPFFF